MVAVGALGQLGLDVHQRLVVHRVERLARLAEADHPELGQHALELVGDRPRTGRPRGHRAGAPGGCRPAPGSIASMTLPTATSRCDLAVTVDPPLVVDVLGLQALQVAGAARRPGWCPGGRHRPRRRSAASRLAGRRGLAGGRLGGGRRRGRRGGVVRHLGLATRRVLRRTHLPVSGSSRRLSRTTGSGGPSGRCPAGPAAVLSSCWVTSCPGSRRPRRPRRR